MEYHDFLKRKTRKIHEDGFDISELQINKKMYPFQKKIIRWALKKGRAAIFADCGLGKTPMQLEWARHVFAQTGRDVLIFAPLAVNKQTHEEGKKFDIPVHLCRRQSDIKPGINITNYEMMQHYDCSQFAGIVLDESSILKGFGGKYRKELNIFAENIPYRLCCTATPAPNDYIELINHAEFLGIMHGKEMIALFFTTDGNTTHKWRLKGHAVEKFWEWMASWSAALRKPSDISFDDDGFILPPIKFFKTEVPSEAPEEYLFAIEAQTLNDQRRAQRESLPRRLERIVNLRNEVDGQLLVWTHYNYESDAIHKAITDSVEVKGADPIEHKENALLGFKNGEIKTLITKPSIAGFGMNWQSCHTMVFASLSHSYEQFYQATRRCWRFGQKKQVDVHLITSEAESKIVNNIVRKEKQVAYMMDRIIERMKDYNLNGHKEGVVDYKTDHVKGDKYEMHLGDSIELIDRIPDESVDLTIFSPPFPGMYAYTNSERDLGNSRNQDELMQQFSYLMARDKMYRVMVPGRMVAIHITQEPAFKGKDGYMGLKDYRGNIISTMVENGWIYYGEVTIDKDPQLKAQRTKDLGLLFKTLAKDSALLRMAMADYLLYFRKPGDNPKPIKAGISEKYNSKGWITQNEWIEWAAPVWYRKTENYPGGIWESDVLNTRSAKAADDEKHICPLQLGVIHRAVYLWSAPGEVVFSPFAGIGSEGYQAILDGRRFVGIELKEEYYNTAIKNLEQAQRQYKSNSNSLFDVENEMETADVLN